MNKHFEKEKEKIIISCTKQRKLSVIPGYIPNITSDSVIKEDQKYRLYFTTGERIPLK